MTSCREVRTRVFEAVEGDLAIEHVLALEEHARSCAGCREVLARARTLQDAFARLAAPPIDRLDVENSVAVIRARIERTQRVPRATKSVARRLAAAAILLAAAGVAAFFWLHSRSQQEDELATSSPDATAESTVRLADASTSDPAVPSAEGSLHVSQDVPVAVVDGPADSPTPTATSEIAEPIDAARLASAREAVRASLIEAAPRLTDASAAAFVANIDESLRGRAREGWPIARLVEGFADDPDRDLARAALRWLGVRGDRLCDRSLKNALADPERKRAACLALADRGSRSLDALAGALLDDELRALTLDATRTRGTNVLVIERALRGLLPREARRVPALVAELTTALACAGRSGIERVLALASDGALDETDALDAISRSPGAAEVLAEIVRVRPHGSGDPTVLRAVRDVRALGGLAWVEESAFAAARRGDGAVADLALEVLSELGGVESLRALLRVRASGRFDGESVARALDGVLARDASAADALAHDLVRGRKNVEARELQDLLAANPIGPVVPALLTLAGSDVLPNADRRFAILLAGEIGDSGAGAHESLVADLYERLGRNERDLRAACLVTLHSLGGREAVVRALDGSGARTHSRVLALLENRDARDKPLTTLTKLARELEPLLASPQP